MVSELMGILGVDEVELELWDCSGFGTWDSFERVELRVISV